MGGRAATVLSRARLSRVPYRSGTTAAAAERFTSRRRRRRVPGNTRGARSVRAAYVYTCAHVRGGRPYATDRHTVFHFSLSFFVSLFFSHKTCIPVVSPSLRADDDAIVLRTRVATINVLSPITTFIPHPLIPRVTPDPTGLVSWPRAPPGLLQSSSTQDRLGCLNIVPRDHQNTRTLMRNNAVRTLYTRTDYVTSYYNIRV